MLTTPEGQQIVELQAHNTLGRHPSNSVQVLDKIVSKEHCIVVQRGGQFILQDLGSLNGTYINNERVIGERGLKHGDEILLGSTRARFDGGQGFGVASAAPLSPQGAAPAQAPTSAAWRAAGAPSAAQPPRMDFAHVTGSPAVTAQVPASQQRPVNQTRVDVSNQDRSIGTQINAAEKGFQPYSAIASNHAQLQADYERLRLSHELSRDICLERDLTTLLNKVLISMFRFVRADRGVIFLRDSDGDLQPGASLRRDGSAAAITVSSTIMDHVIKERAAVLTHDAAGDFAGSKGKSMILHRISSAIVVPLMHNTDILGVLWLDSETLAQFTATDLEMVTAIANQAAMFIEINILGRKVEQEIVNRERFSRLLSPNVADKVLKGEMVIQKGGQLVPDCTVFNSDIRGFTRMSDGADPPKIVDWLNEYFERMVEVIFKYEGTLDKFMGDGIMALWGAPGQHKEDAARCVACGLEQISTLDEFNRERSKANEPPLGIGIGVHSGPVVAGYIGSSKALSYTVIGDTANTSARLCGVAEPGQLIVSEATLGLLGGKFPHKELPPANLKGKAKPFRMFSISRGGPSVQIPAGR